MSDSKSLKVWVDKTKSGTLAQVERKKHVFSYASDAKDAVSLTMPIRLESWVTPELHPIFQMNLPEGELLEAIRRAIAKIVGDDDLSILQVTGGNQIGKSQRC